jgi:hypothetical protein
MASLDRRAAVHVIPAWYPSKPRACYALWGLVPLFVFVWISPLPAGTASSPEPSRAAMSARLSPSMIVCLGMPGNSRPSQFSRRSASRRRASAAYQ